MAIKGDTRSLDYSSEAFFGIKQGITRETAMGFAGIHFFDALVSMPEHGLGNCELLRGD